MRSVHRRQLLRSFLLLTLGGGLLFALWARSLSPLHRIDRRIDESREQLCAAVSYVALHEGEVREAESLDLESIQQRIPEDVSVHGHKVRLLERAAEAQLDVHEISVSAQSTVLRAGEGEQETIVNPEQVIPETAGAPALEFANSSAAELLGRSLVVSGEGEFPSFVRWMSLVKQEFDLLAVTRVQLDRNKRSPAQSEESVEGAPMKFEVEFVAVHRSMAGEQAP